MEIIAFLNDKIIWGAPMICAMLFTGVYFSVKSRFFQVRKFGLILKSTVFSREKRGENGTSPFQAMCQALAATLGTGNIAGVGSALAIGGAGAVFWMWVCAVFGMMTGFAENVLGFLYRKRDKNGNFHGGAMYYIRDGLEKKSALKRIAKPLSLVYSGLCLLAGFGMGNAAQMNSAAEALKVGFGLPPIVTGIALAALAAVVVFGGVNRIASFSAKIVPIMSGFYIIGSAYILIANAARLPEVFGEIFGSAFGVSAVGGGIFGAAVKTAVSMGFKRGAFSNEAGLGTSVFAHTASDIKSAKICGMWSVFEVFFDTIVMCGLTAVVLLTSGCGLPDKSTALSCVSEQTQYFRLDESDRIISQSGSNGEKAICFGVHGERFYAEIPNSAPYSNVMQITGISRSGKMVGAEIEPVSGAGLASIAFKTQFGDWAGGVLSVLVAMFAFSTVIGWSYFGSEAARFLFGNHAEKPFLAIFTAFSVVGAAVNMALTWGIADMLNGLMALPNLFAVFALRKEVINELKK